MRAPSASTSARIVLASDRSADWCALWRGSHTDRHTGVHLRQILPSRHIGTFTRGGMLPISRRADESRRGWRRRRERGQLSSADLPAASVASRRARRSPRRSPSRCPCRPHAASGRARRAPVECGDLPFLIRRDGTWLYRGSPIDRKELVCLFASVLKREADGSLLAGDPGRARPHRGRGRAVRRRRAGLDGRWPAADAVVPHQCGPGGDRRVRIIRSASRTTC